ncbi:NADH-quinone oxidoreductase subunit J [Plesiomonas sp.]|uniref:NADH-quinone oxidoreductase subunit J n=1 Tax=Plesiomonas sp. TaxID=2486279 RepID=UPI003F360453
MNIPFYAAGAIALIATFRVISNRSPMHALLYLIISLLSVAMVFFTLGAEFAGAVQIIVYAGAILVLFVFVVMMLNIGTSEDQEKQWLKPRVWIGPAILSVLLLVIIAIAIGSLGSGVIGSHDVPSKAVGISLFGPYVLGVELASLLLLAGVVSAYHLGRENKLADSAINRSQGDKR